MSKSDFESLVRGCVRDELESVFSSVVNRAVKDAAEDFKVFVGNKTGKPAVGIATAMPKTAVKGVKAAKAVAVKTRNGSKSAFIRSMPDASPKEIVAAAAKAGIKLVPTQVYGVRAADKKAAAAAPKAGRKPKAKAPVAEPVAETAGTEAAAPSGEAEETPAPTVEQVLVGITKSLKGETLSVKAIAEALTKKKLMPNASEPLQYLEFLLDQNKDLFSRAGKSRYKRAPKAKGPKAKAATQAPAVKAKAPKAPKAPKAEKKVAKKVEGHGAMSAFVREQLAKGLTVKQVVEAGAKAGLPVKAGLVYNVSGTMKKEGASSPKASRVAAASKVGDPAPAEVVETVAVAPAEVVETVAVAPADPAAQPSMSELMGDEDGLDLSILAGIAEDSTPTSNPFEMV